MLELSLFFNNVYIILINGIIEMIETHLYGKFRALVPGSKCSEDTILMQEYKEGETFNQFIERIGLKDSPLIPLFPGLSGTRNYRGSFYSLFSCWLSISDAGYSSVEILHRPAQTEDNGWHTGISFLAGNRSKRDLNSIRQYSHSWSG